MSPVGRKASLGEQLHRAPCRTHCQSGLDTRSQPARPLPSGHRPKPARLQCGGPPSAADSVAPYESILVEQGAEAWTVVAIERAYEADNRKLGLETTRLQLVGSVVRAPPPTRHRRHARAALRARAGVVGVGRAPTVRGRAVPEPTPSVRGIGRLPSYNAQGLAWISPGSCGSFRSSWTTEASPTPRRGLGAPGAWPDARHAGCRSRGDEGPGDEERSAPHFAGSRRRAVPAAAARRRQGRDSRVLRAGGAIGQVR